MAIFDLGVVMSTFADILVLYLVNFVGRRIPRGTDLRIGRTVTKEERKGRRVKGKKIIKVHEPSQTQSKPTMKALLHQDQVR